VYATAEWITFFVPGWVILLYLDLGGGKFERARARCRGHLEASGYWPWPFHIFFVVLPPPHGGYITVTEKPARASEQRAWAGF